MATYEEVQAFSRLLQDLTFDDKISLVTMIGLYAAYCPDCQCTLGSPYCHPLPEINAYLVQEDGCPSPCLYKEAEEAQTE